MKKAFTLAEVLITLMILGVIAMLVVPGAIQRADERATVVKVKKFYSQLNNAYNRAVVENGTADQWGITDQNGVNATKVFNILIKPYFSIAKDCGLNNQGNCISNKVNKYLNGSDHVDYGSINYFYKVLLNDGSAIVVNAKQADMPFVIYYYTNSSQSSYQWGYDLFYFEFYNGRLRPAGEPEGYRNKFDYNCANKSAHSGFGCAAWVVEKGNMDYLHCDGLSWNGKQKCD